MLKKYCGVLCAVCKMDTSFNCISFPPVVATDDYMVPADLTATFPVGSASGSSACVNLTIVDDGILEGNETLSVLLSIDTPNANMGSSTAGTVTIRDNESMWYL